MRSSLAIVILFLLLVISDAGFSQATTNSIYSKYGIGVIRPMSFSQNYGMGGVGIGLRSHRNIYLLNPASFSALGSTTFDIGYTNNALSMTDGTENQYKNNSYVDHLAFALPMVKDKWGLSFGLLPYSNTGYSFDEVIVDSIAGSYSEYNFGEGAINKAYFGNAVAIKLDSTSVISVGANANFYFGSMYYDYRAILGDLPNSYNIWNAKEVSVADAGFDLGLQYHKKFYKGSEETYSFTLGATYSLAADLKGKRTEVTRTFSGADHFITSNELRDTAEIFDDVDHVTSIPAELGFGFSLEKKNKWLIAADFKTADWGSILSNDALYNYQSNYSIAAGVEVVPKHDANSFFKRVAYRLGTKYSTSYIAINNIDWSEYGITFGFGLPIRRSENSYPRLNLGFEYGGRGVVDSGLIKEKFFNFNVGITINAVWFRKRKYD